MWLPKGLTAGARRGPRRPPDGLAARILERVIVVGHDVALWVDAEEVSRKRAGCADCLPGSETVIGQERDLIRDSADDIGAGQYPDAVGDGIGESFAQLVCSPADLRIGGVAVVEHGAERRRPRAAARPQRLDLGMAQRLPVLDRIRADRRQPRIRERGLLCTATLAPAAWAASTAWRSVSRS
jgi:hypothetical protein